MGRKMSNMVQEVGNRRYQGSKADVHRTRTLVLSDRRPTAEEVYGNLFERKDSKSGPTSGFATMTMALRIMCYDFKISWLRNPLRKWTIHLIPSKYSCSFWLFSKLRNVLTGKEFADLLNPMQRDVTCEVFLNVIFETASSSGAIASRNA
jgi:hypothetical protein